MIVTVALEDNKYPHFPNQFVEYLFSISLGKLQSFFSLSDLNKCYLIRLQLALINASTLDTVTGRIFFLQKFYLIISKKFGN